MRIAVFTAFALGGLVANTLASPIEIPAVPQPDAEMPSEVEGFGGGDYNAQGNILAVLLGKLAEHADIIDSILGQSSKKPGWGEALKLVRLVAPQLGDVAKLLGGLDIIGKKKSSYVHVDDDDVVFETEAEAAEIEMADGIYGGGGKPKCNKLCVFDLCTKVLMQVYGIAFSVVSKCGLGFTFQYLSPIVLKLVKKFTMLDMVVGGVLEVCQPLLSKVLHMIRLN
ncbi:hypothetical protein PG985_013147 [Apiospora marii]|uniref:Uncharacterized protein n=1 Tax=Apiospora marii TaxID=335849 RepID=A0ABR1R8V0_9PEZI